MKKKLTFLLVLCLGVIAVYYTQRPESKAPDKSVDSGGATGNASRSDTDTVATNNAVRHLLRLQELKRLVRTARNTPDLSPGMLNAPPLHSLPDETDTPEQQAANLAEDAMLDAEAKAPEKIRVLRRTAMSESIDEEWTERMTDEIYEKVDSVLENDADIRDISCFESVCIAFLEFDDEDGAEALTSAGNDLQYEYESQQMPPRELSNDSSDHKKYYYEVLIKKRGVSALSNKPALP